MPNANKAAKSETRVAKKVNTRKASSRALEAVKRRPSMATKPKTIDEYLSNVDGETRQLLEELRHTVHKVVPDAEECISYSMPAFRWQGKVIGGFAATAAGGSYYPFSGTTLATLGDALGNFSQTKSAVHFTCEKPLSRALVRKLLRARMAELDH